MKMYQLAQVNVATAKGSMDSEVMKVFNDNLDPINAIAEVISWFCLAIKR